MEDNVFTIKKVNNLKKHSDEGFNEKKVIKSFTLYNEDINNINDLEVLLQKNSKGVLSHSLIVRIAINHLKNTVEKMDEKNLRRLINDNK